MKDSGLWLLSIDKFHFFYHWQILPLPSENLVDEKLLITRNFIIENLV